MFFLFNEIQSRNCFTDFKCNDSFTSNTKSSNITFRCKCKYCILKASLKEYKTQIKSLRFERRIPSVGAFVLDTSDMRKRLFLRVLHVFDMLDYEESLFASNVLYVLICFRLNDRSTEEQRISHIVEFNINIGFCQSENAIHEIEMLRLNH